MEKEKKKQLELLAVEAREHLLRAIHSSKTGHPGGSLSAIDFLTYLYQEEIRVNPKEPRDPDRDRFVLSKGHVVPALYTALALKGFFPVEDLLTLRKADSYLQGLSLIHI